MRVYYASEEGNIKELLWSFGGDTFDPGHTFVDTNGAGVECTGKISHHCSCWRGGKR